MASICIPQTHVPHSHIFHIVIHCAMTHCSVNWAGLHNVLGEGEHNTKRSVSCSNQQTGGGLLTFI